MIHGESPDMAFIFRAICGCASAVVVEDNETFHYVETLAGWKRRKTGTIERVTVDAAREEFGRTFMLHPSGRQGRQTWLRPHAVKEQSQEILPLGESR